MNTTGALTLPAEAFVHTVADLNVSSTIAGAALSLTKSGGGTLTVGGTDANTFTGATLVAQGVYRAEKATAFGTTGGGVNVAYGATVALFSGSTMTIPAEMLTIAGTGEAGQAAVPLRNVSGTNTWAGPVTLNNIPVGMASNRQAIDVPADTLIINGLIGHANSAGFNKLGAGTLQIKGAATNTYNQTSIVWQGTLELANTAGNAIPNVGLTIGDEVGGADADKLVLLANNQIDDALNVVLRGSAQFDLDNFSDGTAGATLYVGPLASSEIVTGTGTWTVARHDHGQHLQRRRSAGRPRSPESGTSGQCRSGGDAHDSPSNDARPRPIW